VREYVRALDARDGAAVCAVFAPGALDKVKLPVNRDSCAASVSASIGHATPGKLPAWTGGRIVHQPRAYPAGPPLRVTMSVQDSFADHRRTPPEDDVVYLQDVGGRWRIIKPTVVFYRAIGRADIPPSALAPVPSGP
jgi:hypothetical protein